MKLAKQFFAPTLLCAGALGACMGAAAAPVVGGIDFGPVGLFSHIDTTSVYSTYVNGVGQVMTSYGVISTINGDSTYCADGTANCALYFVRSATVSATPGSDLYFNNVKMTLYYSGTAAINLLGQDSAANLSTIGGFTKWATLRGENGVDPTGAGLAASLNLTQSSTGASITSSGGGLLSVDLADGIGLADVEAYLNANTIPTFTGVFADIALTESTNNFVLNPFDLAGAAGDSCLTGAAQVGDWCLGGSGDMRGRTVMPDPAQVPTPGTATLTMLALGLLAGVGRRRAAGLR